MTDEQQAQQATHQIRFAKIGERTYVDFKDIRCFLGALLEEAKDAALHPPDMSQLKKAIDSSDRVWESRDILVFVKMGSRSWASGLVESLSNRIMKEFRKAGDVSGARASQVACDDVEGE